jgi:tetratricopeptide (TPR) repeat protein
LEIARLQALVGQSRSAEKYVSHALALAPKSRYVLRSSTRFLLNVGDFDQALHALRHSEMLSADPWIQAAEVVASDLSGQSSSCARKMKKELLSKQPNDIKFSELASSLAMLELGSGAPIKQVRKFLQLSLRSPTENSLAQAIWSKERTNFEFNFSNYLHKFVQAYEARARAAYEAKDYLGAVEECWSWLQDEPFSVRPAIAGAYTCILLSQYDKALAFADYGLRANPHDRALINDKVISLALGGHVDDAFKMLPALEKYEHDVEAAPFVYAARGLLAFKAGNFVAGREKYATAVKAAAKTQSKSLAVNAMIYWLEQEVCGGFVTAEQARKSLDHVDKLVTGSFPKKLDDPIWIARRAIVDAGILELEKKDTLLRQANELRKSGFEALVG